MSNTQETLVQTKRLLIQHLFVMWDENQHVNAKRLKEYGGIFRANYCLAFPEGAQTSESPTVLSTNSIIFPNVTSFLHKGIFIPHSGNNKDLVIVKYCSTGFMDQNERFTFILDDMRNKKHEKRDRPLGANDACIVVFVTADRKKGMKDAIEENASTKNRITTSVMLSLPQIQGRERITAAGQIIGLETKKRFKGLEDGGLLLDCECP